MTFCDEDLLNYQRLSWCENIDIWSSKVELGIGIGIGNASCSFLFRVWRVQSDHFTKETEPGYIHALCANFADWSVACNWNLFDIPTWIYWSQLSSWRCWKKVDPCLISYYSVCFPFDFDCKTLFTLLLIFLYLFRVLPVDFCWLGGAYTWPQYYQLILTLIYSHMSQS